MSAVAKKKPASDPAIPAPSDTGEGGRARDRGEVRTLSIEIAPLLDDLIERCRQKERRTKRAFIELAVEEYLLKRGYLPPEEDD